MAVMSKRLHPSGGLSYAMVGGGTDSGIGALHRAAAQAAGLQLVAGCFSRDPVRNRAAGAAHGLDPWRVAGSLEALIDAESAQAGGARLLVVCTPHVHHAAAVSLALRHGWRVVVEKPLCASAQDVRALDRERDALGQTTDAVVLPLVMRYMPGIERLRSELVAGTIGDVRWLTLEYLQGRERHAHDEWRFQRRSAGPAGTLADLGPHAWDLCHWLSREEPVVRAADVRTLNPARELDDSAWVWLDLGTDVRGQVTLCQAASGLPSECRVRVFGSTGMREWRLSSEAARAGGLDGLYRFAFEAFYRDVTRWHGGTPVGDLPTLPRWQDGVRGVSLTQACLEAGASRGPRETDQ
jgi:predicted dehydrogenase